MDHQTYRTWIFNQETLTPEEREKLDKHLADCPECFQLNDCLETAIRSIHSVPEQAVPANFTNRWTASLASRKRQEEKKQAKILGISLAGTAFLVAVGALIIFAPQLSLISLTAGLISTVVTLLSDLQGAVGFIANLFKTLNPTTLIAAVAVIGIWILLASFTLGLSIWKLAIKKVEIKS